MVETIKQSFQDLGFAQKEKEKKNPEKSLFIPKD